MIRVVVATSNPGKIREFGAALAGTGIETSGLDSLADRSPVEETGSTFEENAKIKAEAYSLRTDLAVLAEDSGLEVDALGGEPGVLSARFGGPDLDDPGRCRLVLRRLEGIPDDARAARFHCVIAVARHGATLSTFHGVVEGHILRQARGTNGFGYDPIFFHPGIGRTFGEITREEKQSLSHRGRAIAAFVRAVQEGRLRVSRSSSVG